MDVLVTGAAGFIGSSIVESLLTQGHQVLGIDCFTEYYPRRLKEENLVRLKRWPSFHFVEANLTEVDESTLSQWFRQHPFVIHAAAQPGVRFSWGKSFNEYVQNNISLTQRLLEAAKQTSIQRFVYTSSSSVYGQPKHFPVVEDTILNPISPYGVTKLAGEHLANLYYINEKVPTVSLRYFTVYGPRQRPDMGFFKMISAHLEQKPFTVLGDGSQSRQFTYVDDVVAATIKALFAPPIDKFLGKAINISGNECVMVREVIQLIEEITGVKMQVHYSPAAKGDVEKTEADISRAQQWLGYQPIIAIREGLQKQIAWQSELSQTDLFNPKP